MINAFPSISTDNLKDLQRFLRRDDPHTREVFKQLCKWNVVSRDLIPLMENYQDDRNLVINGGNRFSLLTILRTWQNSLREVVPL